MYLIIMDNYMNFEINKITKKVLLLSFLSGMFSSQVSGFYYEEHKYVTQKALELTQASNQIVINQIEIKKGIGSDFLCGDLLDPEPGECFTLADLPALAGDHAGSPMLMQWKWFNDKRDPYTIVRVADYLASIRIIAEDECYSSETTISKVPNRIDFAALMHASPDASSFGEDLEISKSDSNYARSAAHNCNHFRNGNAKSPEEIMTDSGKSYTTDIWSKSKLIPYFVTEYFESLQSENRVREKPNLEAGAWYAQLHASALELASYPDATSQAAAWLFETYALHFLQDGVSAGHVATPSDGGLSVLLVTKKVHDEFSKNGLDVVFDNACNELTNLPQGVAKNFPDLEVACKKSPVGGVIYGDKQLVAKKSGLTKDLAIFLSYISLKEFGQAVALQKPLLPPQIIEANYQRDPHWTFQGMDNEDLAKKLFVWWESAGRKDPSSPMEMAAVEYYKVGKIKAITLWPIAKASDSIAKN
ncbi:hypothetical protein GP2143_01635 [marine gamma proteobacterium HTCC2143]|uniref:Uncharacterized protein n=1 Tax=marine gamma proteobacterium HTCC2143 TaxID=247633 RepID=A0YFV4_9GAMM|nr:hypothetical protein GP2143_01635 [marine gamma proteobacterium HTCC2143]